MDARLTTQLEFAAVGDQAFVEQAYALLLRRTPDAAAQARALASLADGTLSRATLLSELASSEEFQRVRSLDDAVAFAAWARAHGERPRELRAGRGDERPVEICWTLSRLRSECRVLDVGTANADPAYVAGLIAASFRELVGLDTAELDVPGLRAVQGDLRSLPFPDESFDVALCISTLEHVGRDNAVYGGATELDERGMEQALRELRRILAGDGRLLVTVPTGACEDHGWFVQLPPAEWLALFRRADLLVFEREVYAQGPNGWAAVADGSVEGLRYGAAGPGAAAVLCAELRPRTLGETLREQARALRRSLLG